MSPAEMTIAQARKALDGGEITSVDLTQACLDNIRAKDSEINAFISVFKDQAMAEATEADKRIATGNQGPLTGIPFCVKDAICTQDSRSTGAAKILDNYEPPFEATVITKIRDQGAVLLGKNNCDTFGHGASNENSMYGPVKNPHDLSKVAGGSSGGSAAAVAADMAIFSIAEDTGGSIRFPASLCGIYGLRPSYGRNSRYGIMPMASSLDTVGPMAKSVEDIALLTEIMAGQDAKDATTVGDSVPSYTAAIQENKPMRIGVPKEYLDVDGMDDEVRTQHELLVKRAQDAGMEIVEVSLPHTKYAIAAYYIIVPSEDSSNLGRLDGIRYGVQDAGQSLYDVYAQSRAAGFPQEVKRRIMVGTYALSAGYYDAYYKKAQKVRTLIQQDFTHAFTNVDVLLTPTSPYPAFDIGAKVDDVLAMYLADVLVSPAALAGVPAISIPAGTSSAGLPIGMQIIGPRLGEEKVLNAAQRLVTSM